MLGMRDWRWRLLRGMSVIDGISTGYREEETRDDVDGQG